VYAVSVGLIPLVSLLFVKGCSLIVSFIVACLSVDDYFALIVIDVRTFAVRIS
jgi:hypothetical protein